LLLMIQFASISFSLVFSLITARLNMTFVPIRDYRVFVDKLEILWNSTKKATAPENGTP
jgi:hypothetical protein